MEKKEEYYFKRIAAGVIILALMILLFFLLRPILLAIIFGIILAFLFFPIYSWFYKKTKIKTLSAVLVCLLLVIVIVVPIAIALPYIVKQLINSYNSFSQIDILTPLKTFFPNFLTNESNLIIIENAIKSTVNNIINSILNSLTIDNIVSFFFQFVVVFFTFFFALRDNEELNQFIKKILPFSKEVEDKLYKFSKDITASVLYGQILIGIIQGVSIGIGFFLFSVPNALLLSVLAIIAGIFPIVGTVVIWVPVLIYLLIAGNTGAVFGILFFGLFSSNIDNILRPILVSKKTSLNSSLILIGMIGGWFLFGILGIVLGPLIIAYSLVILESYQNNKGSNFFKKQT